jgi:hypothetical protein
MSERCRGRPEPRSPRACPVIGSPARWRATPRRGRGRASDPHQWHRLVAARLHLHRRAEVEFGIHVTR